MFKNCHKPSKLSNSAVDKQVLQFLTPKSSYFIFSVSCLALSFLKPAFIHHFLNMTYDTKGNLFLLPLM